MDFITGGKYARYEAGLNGFKYCASLHVEHPSMTCTEITDSLGIPPDTCHEKGAKRRRPDGSELQSVWESADWRMDLKLEDRLSLDEFVQSLTTRLATCREALQKIHDTGGRICCFVGIFADGLCDTEFPCELLSSLGELKIDLRLDFYGPQNSPPS